MFLSFSIISACSDQEEPVPKKSQEEQQPNVSNKPQEEERQSHENQQELSKINKGNIVASNTQAGALKI